MTDISWALRNDEFKLVSVSVRMDHLTFEGGVGSDGDFDLKKLKAR